MPDSSPQPNVSGDEGFSPQFWLLVVLTGVLAGLAASVLMMLLYTVEHFSWQYQSGQMLDAVRRTTVARRFLVLLCAGLIAGLGVRWRRHIIKGHAGDVAEALWFRSGDMPTLSTLFTAVLSIVIVGMGASLGREGALKKAGGAIAAWFARWGKLPPAQERLLVACGVGAGIAAAYNVPFGGALFALEVLLGTMAISLVLPALITSLIATGISWFFLQDKPVYSISSFGAPVSLIVWAAVCGPLIGLAAAGYIRVISWADATKWRGWRAIAAPLLVFAALGAASAFFPELLGNGKDLVEETLANQVNAGLMPLLLGLKLLATLGCLGSGAPGGLFTPTIACGTLLGSCLGWPWERLWPGGAPASYALVGAGALLAAATKGPVSTIVLLLELTHRVDSSMVPLMLAVATATLVARALEPRSIYTARVG